MKGFEGFRACGFEGFEASKKAFMRGSKRGVYPRFPNNYSPLLPKAPQASLRVPWVPAINR